VRRKTAGYKICYSKKTIERGKGIPLYCFLHIQNRGSEPDVLPLKYGYDIIII
jgi:hypothetical protein